MYNILVVDDEEKIVNVLEEFLEKMGFEVIKAAGGVKGLEALRSDAKIDLMIVDMKMPKVAGHDVLKERERVRKGLPVIILTGSIDAGKFLADLDKTEYGEGDILHKPVDLFALLELVKKKLQIA